MNVSTTITAADDRVVSKDTTTTRWSRRLPGMINQPHSADRVATVSCPTVITEGRLTVSYGRRNRYYKAKQRHDRRKAEAFRPDHLNEVDDHLDALGYGDRVLRLADIEVRFTPASDEERA